VNISTYRANQVTSTYAWI